MLIKLRKAQNTAEYAIVLGLVVGAVVAMQVFVKRNLQARIKSVTDFTETNTSGYGVNYSYQYEPYYLDSQFVTVRDSSGYGDIDVDESAGYFARRGTSDNITREVGGVQYYKYNASEVGSIMNETGY